MSKFEQYLIESEQNLMEDFKLSLQVVLENKELLEAEVALPFVSSTWNRIVMEVDMPQLKDKQTIGNIEKVFDYLEANSDKVLSSSVLKIALKQLKEFINSNQNLKDNLAARNALKNRTKPNIFDQGSDRASDLK